MPEEVGNAGQRLLGMNDCHELYRRQGSQITTVTELLATGHGMYVFIFSSLLAKRFHKLKMAGFRTGCTDLLDSPNHDRRGGFNNDSIFPFCVQ